MAPGRRAPASPPTTPSSSSSTSWAWAARPRRPDRPARSGAGRGVLGGLDGDPVTVDDPLGPDGGDAGPGKHDASEVERIGGVERHGLAGAVGSPDPAEVLHRLGQGELLTGEARHEPPA